jgi:Zn-finger protein
VSCQSSLHVDNCARCLCPAPHDDDPASIDWEVGEDGGELSVCPDCITPEEQQAMDEVGMALTDELNPRDARGRFRPR